jgi:spore germination protein KC
VLAAVKRAQEFNSDVLGFGEAVYRKYPGMWEQSLSHNWTELFPRLNVNVTAYVNIKGTGAITNSVNVRKPTVK